MIELKMHGKSIGVVHNQIFRTVREAKRNHLFRLFNGFGISIKLLYYLEDRGISRVSIKYILKNKVLLYETSVGTFLMYGRLWVNPKDKDDIQLILPRASMLEINENGTWKAGRQRTYE